MLQMFGEKLKLALKQRGISQEELSRRTKISKGAIARYIDGSRSPVVENLILIAKSLNVGYDEIISWFENGTPNLKRESLKERFMGLFDSMSELEQEIYVEGMEVRTRRKSFKERKIERKTKEAPPLRNNH